MLCPTHANGIHDLGTSLTCSCGYRLVIPPISVEITVMHRATMLVSRHFNCENVRGAIEALREAADILEESQPLGGIRS